MKRYWLENIRKKHGMTHEEVAKISGIHRQYYSMIEAGERRPSVDTAKSIARALGFHWPSFFEEEGNKVIQKEVKNDKS